MKFLAVLPVMVLAVPNVHAVSLISLNFSGPVSAIQQQTFNDAAAFWNSAITGYDLQYNNIGQIQPHSLSINVTIPTIDGAFGILGSAGPDTATYYDNNPVGAPTVALYYTTTGSMEFDSADVDMLIANNTFYGVVLHEMAHVLGIGTLWTFNTNLNSTTYNLYTSGSGQYYGTNALAEWRNEFNRPGDTFVPVELGGGPGTANGHWNEIDNGAGSTGIVSNLTGMDFSNELMTGWASGSFFISRTTLGTLDDLGYIVDYSKAGIINHTPVPEFSSACLGMLACGLLIRRRR
jgi:hypothetical protein